LAFYFLYPKQSRGPGTLFVIGMLAYILTMIVFTPQNTSKTGARTLLSAFKKGPEICGQECPRSRLFFTGRSSPPPYKAGNIRQKYPSLTQIHRHRRFFM